MRDDTIKRLLRGRRPTPTRDFTERVMKTLTLLPERKKANVLHYLPRSVIVFAAVAVVCLVAVNQQAVGRFFSLSPSGGQYAAGDLPVQTGDMTAAPALENTAEPTPDQTPVPTPEDTVEATAFPGTGDLTAPPTDQPDQSTMEPTPTPTPEEPAMTAAAPQMTAMSCQGDVVGGSGSGKIAFGISCGYVHAVVNDTGTYYVIKGNTTDDLVKYCDSYSKSSKNGPFTKYELDPMVHPSLIFVLIDGLVDESFVGTTISEEKLNLLIAANDDSKSDGVYVRGLLSGTTLELAGKSGFELTIRNTNLDFRPTSDFTILTRYATDDGKVHYCTLPVKSR